MPNIENGPERIDVGVARADGAYWLWRDIIEPTKPVFEKVEYVRADIHQGAMPLLTEIGRSANTQDAIPDDSKVSVPVPLRLVRAARALSGGSRP